MSRMTCLFAEISVHYINKIVGFAISPIGGTIFGGVLALMCAKKGRLCPAKWIGCLTFAWLWLWMTPILTFFVGVPLEREFLVEGKVPLVETYPEADVIVLLGGSMGVDTNLSGYAEMWGSADRVWQAARLYKAGKSKKIIATGDFAEASTLALLHDFGVAEKDISFMDARNTEGEAKGIARKGYRKILLVTSAWHMKRARMMFEMYAPEIEVVCAPADFENSMAAERGLSIVPDINVFTINSVAFHEWVGIVGYTLFR